MAAISSENLVKLIKSFDNVIKTNPFEKPLDVYSVEYQMFALINNKDPIIVSLRCDKQLSDYLQEKYESVMPGQKLDQDKWISIVNSGQIPEDELKDLIVLSYNLAKQTA
jgi:predicted DNA-binding protein (MmcQ/YjbR family)